MAHVTTEAHRFVHGLLAPRLAPVGDQPFRGVSVWLSAEARERAAAFLRRAGLDDEPMVLLSPDASSPFTRPPLTVQTELLRRLLRLAGRVVLGAGHTEPGLEQRLLAALPPAQRARIAVLPATLPLDGFAAVMDAAAVLVTGDTGPLHVAAARKQRRDGALGGLRNRTALVSVFGATPARMYGYASDRAGFLPANQEAPSYAHAGASACRNLTCIRKTAKTCRSVRCFDGLDIEAVLADAGGALAAAGRPGAIGRSTGR